MLEPFFFTITQESSQAFFVESFLSFFKLDCKGKYLPVHVRLLKALKTSLLTLHSLAAGILQRPLSSFKKFCTTDRDNADLSQADARGGGETDCGKFEWDDSVQYVCSRTYSMGISLHRMEIVAIQRVKFPRQDAREALQSSHTVKPEGCFSFTLRVSCVIVKLQHLLEINAL